MPSSTTTTRRACAALVVALLMALGGLGVPKGTPSASAAVGDPSIVQCFFGGGAPPCTAITPSWFWGWDSEFSPDGRQLYALTLGGPPGIRMFDRGADNSLTPRAGLSGCYHSPEAEVLGFGSCALVPNLGTLWSLAFSPDGSSAYVASSDNLLHLSRATADGALTPQGCYGPGPGCVAVAPLSNATAVTVSPDGRNVYVRATDRLLVFDRDASTGALKIKRGDDGCFSQVAMTGCTDAMGLNGGGNELSLSPDGRFLYYPNSTGVGSFARAADGTLSQSAPSRGKGSGLAVTVSPSGRHVFLVGSDWTEVFARNANTGLLTRTDCVALHPIGSDCRTTDQPAGVKAAVSPDGTQVVLGAAARYSGGVAFYAFDQKTGHLAFESCATTPVVQGCVGGVPGSCFCPSGAATWSPDGLNAYFGVLGLFYNVAVDAAPVCHRVSAMVANFSPTRIQLSCSDPNGDAMTVAVGAPKRGHLGSVQPGIPTVDYRPRPGYSGPDSFTYTATAKGVTSAPAKVSLEVRPALNVGPGTLKLNAQHRARVRLACPTVVGSRPCTGTLAVKTRGTVMLDGRKRIITLASATFSVPFGRTTWIRVAFDDRMIQVLEARPRARGLRLVAKVKVAPGKKVTVRTKAKLTLPPA